MINNNIILSTSNSIVKTDDGGITWESLSIPNFGVNKTSFTNSLIGHAVCNGGTILKTIDGGQNWYTTQSTNTFPSDFFTVYFVNETIGFATREHDDMYKTTDAGETWIKISGPGEAIYDFHFLDENNGFATGDHGATYKTNDSGTSWIQIFFQNGFVYNTSMYGIYFQDNNIGYATGARGRIIKTIDGGNTWTPHSENYNDFNDIRIFDSGTGFARSGSNYYKTTDFGDNWSYISTADHFSYCSGFYFVNENIGYSIGGGTNSISGDVFKTTDGGNTWNQLSIYVDEGLSSVFFIDENIGFISGGFNWKKVMKTVDGGVNWTQVSNQEFGQIQFINNQVGYGNRIGNYYGAMYKTIDGGETWNISLELEGEDINAFHFVDENNGYFVGDQGLIYKTNDGGTNWEALDVPYEDYVFVEFHTQNVGFAGGNSGRIYKTQNAGNSWQLMTTISGISDLQISDSKIFLAGSNGKIYRSNAIQYSPMVFNVDSAENITATGVTLSGNATSNDTSFLIEFHLVKIIRLVIPLQLHQVQLVQMDLLISLLIY
ncbi:YCF48-related protein [Formosa sp. L2A11]|uniref:WD40/YVTN/BNR-like repeat-containing protein n=1 Tax=Formosa sp. L2A11 TaxID=2686363 RepID=UPI00131BC5D8|nr:YCF48-related protein [Formosa sp. L2A11]